MENKPKFTSDRKTLYMLVIVVTVASIAYRLIEKMALEQDAVLFIGLPAIITLMIIRFTETPKAAPGIIFKAITIFLLLSGIILGEGFICILIAAPLFYGVGAIIVLIIHLMNKRNKSNMNILIALPVILLLAEPMRMAKAPVERSVTSTTTVSGLADINALNKPVDFMPGLPAFLKIGFPKPINISGAGIAEGDTRIIQFESSTKGVGELHLEVVESGPGKIRFDVVKDDSHIAHWLAWRSIEVTVVHKPNRTSTVTWTSNYTCELGPGWYFEPLEKFTVAQSNKYLLASYFQ